MVELFVGLKAIHLIYNFSDLEPKTYFTFLFRTRHQSQKFILQKRLRSWRLENKLNGNTISKLFKTLDSPSIKPWNMETKWNTFRPLLAWMFATVMPCQPTCFMTPPHQVWSLSLVLFCRPPWQNNFDFLCSWDRPFYVKGFYGELKIDYKLNGSFRYPSLYAMNALGGKMCKTYTFQ